MKKQVRTEKKRSKRQALPSTWSSPGPRCVSVQGRWGDGARLINRLVVISALVATIATKLQLVDLLQCSPDASRFILFRSSAYQGIVKEGDQSKDGPLGTIYPRPGNFSWNDKTSDLSATKESYILKRVSAVWVRLVSLLMFHAGF